MISEKDMENSIISDPEKYLGEQGLKLLAQQHRIGNYIFDILFEDRHGAKMIVEVQKGALDRVHTYKILDYYHEYKENHPFEFVELMVVANKIPDERKKRLSDWGVTFKEIPIEVFVSFNKVMGSTESQPMSCSPQKMSERDDANIDSLPHEIKGSLPIFKNKFQKAFDKCSPEISSLFLCLLSKFEGYPITQYTVDKPDYRFSKKFVFCAIVLQRKCLLIEVRVDDYVLTSKLFTFSEINDATRPGKRWLTFRINDRDQVEEAASIIDEVYRFSA